MFVLREYQEKGVDACKRVLTSKTPIKRVVVAPTGAGKSLYIGFAAKSVDYPLIVLQPSKELLKQNYKKYVDLGGEASIYCVSAKEFQKNNVPYTNIDDVPVPCQEIGKVTYATIGSIMKDWKKFKDLKVRGIIIDECHINTQNDSQIKKFVKKLKIKNLLGLTATPIYLQNTVNGSTLKLMTRVRTKLFTDIEHVTQIQELVKNKFWSPLVYRVFEENGNILRPNSSGSDFTEKSQKEFFEMNNLDVKVVNVVKKLREQGIRKSILIFAPSIEDAEALKRKIPKSSVVHSKMSPSDREDVINKFRNLEIDVVINVNILSVGFDHPQLDTIITTRPTMSMGIYYQQIGRGVRIHPDKKSCAIIDFSGNYHRFGRIENLNFEFIEGYGWGMFNGDELISDVPIALTHKPTKDSLGLDRDKNGYVKFTFGKYKGKSVFEVGKKDKQYLDWLFSNLDFKDKGEEGLLLKKDIKNYLRL
jgi:DNA repair protein RadD